MATKKISELPLIAAVSGSQFGGTVLPVVVGGTTDQISVEDFSKFITAYSAHTGSAGNTFTGPQTINNNVTINGNEVVNGNVTISGKLTVYEVVAQYETASVLFSSGSNKFGDALVDVHEFTGSTNITGSFIVNGASFTNLSSSNSTTFTNYSSSNSNTFTNLSSSNSTAFTNLSSSNSTTFTNLSSSNSTTFTNLSSSNSTTFTNYSSSVSQSISFYSSSNSTTFTNLSSSNSTTFTNLSSSNSTTFTNYSSSTETTINNISSGVGNELARVYQTTASLNTQTGSQNSLNTSLGLITASIYGEITSINSVFGGVSSVTGAYAVEFGSINSHILKQATQTGSQDLVNLGISTATGSLIGITNGLMAFTAALDSTYATDAQLYQLYHATASLNTQTGSQSNLNAQIGIATSSLNSVSASLIGITNGLMAFTAALDSTYATDAQLYQLYHATASLNTQTGSQDLVNLGISTYTGSQNVINNSVDSHILGVATYTGSQNTINNSVDSHILGIATYTGSNELWKAGVRGEVSGLEAYTSSLKSAVTVNGSDATILGNLTINQNLNVLGSASINYITSSQLNIADNIISVNTFTPAIRFGGFSVIDSGSNPQQSGSLLFDSQENQWVYVHQTAGTVTSSLLLMGPQTYDSLGSEINLTSNRLIKSVNNEHVGDTNITDNGTVVSINSNTEVTGSKFEIYNPNASSTMYAVVKNNRSRNAAVKTTTTNGSFIAGTSIGTDTFQYQIYDEVEGVNRVTINSQGGTTLQGAVTASQTITANGNITAGTQFRSSNGTNIAIMNNNGVGGWDLNYNTSYAGDFTFYGGGTGTKFSVNGTTGVVTGTRFAPTYVTSTSGYENITNTVSTAGGVYYFVKDSGAGEGSSATTFNITGVPDTDGAGFDLTLVVKKSATVANINTSAIVQINGNTIGEIATVFASGTAAVTTIKTARMVRVGGNWRPMGGIGTY